MALTNSQYAAIMREYGNKQTITRHRLNERTQEVYNAVPEYKTLLDNISILSVDAAKIALDGDTMALNNLNKDIATIERKLTVLLTSNGFSADYLEPQYSCPLCKDTGYINNEKCHCFIQASINLLYKQSNLEEILKYENFDTFSLKYYSNDVTDPVTGLTPYANAQKVFTNCKSYVDNFPCGENIIFYGNTGVGKTFLSNCIAKALLDKANSVLYMSAIDLFDCMSPHYDNNDSSGIETPPIEEQIYTCELLIIDDLGTELYNSFTNSRLFHCLNSRLQNNLSTIISTNLTQKELMDTYSERIFSRIFSSFKLFKLYGDDIRLLKK